MNKGRLKGSEKKHLSIVIIPHSSSHVKVLRFTSFYGKFLVVLVIILAVLAGTGIFISKTLSENKNLKSDLVDLYSANSEQKQLLDEKSKNIDQLKEKEATFDQNVNTKISEFTDKFNQITDKYISGQDGKTSRSGDRNNRTFADEIKDLKAILDSINVLYDRADMPQADLSAAEAKLDKYMETIPTLWPVSGRLSDSFGNRKDPFTGRTAFHEGLDIGADNGTKIQAAASGKVILAERYGGFGRAVIIDHGRGLKTLYGHASKLLVRVGQIVKKGDVIAEVGSSGRSTGPHLHFEVMLYDTPVDPQQYLDEK